MEEEMENCCSSAGCKPSHPNKHSCPVNGREYAEVSTQTIVHHVKEAWNWNPMGQRFFFCSDPSCDVVYFGDGGSIILKSQLRTPVGTKESGDDALLCYCFGVSKADFRRNPNIKDFVVSQTKSKQCSCTTSNPSGRCCLKDFP